MNLGFTLDSDEKILRQVKRHWIALVPPISFAVLITLVTIGLSVLLAHFKSTLSAAVTPGIVGGLLASLIALAAIILCLGIWIFNRNFIVLTNKHLVLVEQRGLFSRSVSQLSLSRVQDVSGNVNGFWQTTLAYGSIVVQTAGEQDKFIFDYVGSPAQLADECLAAHDAFEATEDGRAASGTE